MTGIETAEAVTASIASMLLSIDVVSLVLDGMI
jgi:hypothetical protein